MKKIVAIFCAFALMFTLSACGGSANSGAPKDYAAIIEAARGAEENESFAIVSDKDSEMADSIFAMLGLAPEDVQDFAVSCSFLNVHAYCVAIIQPASGREDAVQSAVQNYVDLQTKNMENYLFDQYEIAKNAVVKTLKSGEVLAVMAPDSATLAPALEKALK